MVGFEDFLDAELPALTRYAAVLVGDRQGAHDVLADALVAAAARWERIAGLEHPAAYVRRMVTNVFLSGKRRGRLRSIFPAGSGTDLPERSTDPIRAVDDADELRILISTLPRQQRAAIVLRYYLDATDQEIAEHLGCSAPTVRSHLSHAVRALRRTAAESTPNKE